MPTKAIYTRLLIGSADLSGVNNSVTVNINNSREETTGFQSTARTYVALDPEGTIEHSGYFTDDDALEKALADLLINDTTTVVGAGFDTATAGYPVYAIDDAPVSNLEVQGQVGGLITVSGGWSSGAGLERTIELYTGEATATGAGAGRDLGAAGTTGGKAYLWVTAIDGTATNAAIVVESDSASNFASAATEATFDVDGVGAQTIAISGAIGRYARVNVTGLGGATGITFVCALAVNGVTQ